MNSMSTRLLPLGGALAMLLAASPAFAQDATDFATKFSALYGYSGYDITFGEGKFADGTATYDGLAISVPELGLAEPLRLEGDVTVTGLVVNPDGSYTAKAMALPPLEFKRDGISISLADIALTDIVVPAGPTLNAIDATRMLGGMSTGALEITRDGRSIFGFASAKVALSEAAGANGTQMTTETEVAGISFDMSGVDFPELQAGLEVIGLTKGTGSMRQHATWSLDSGVMDIDTTELTIDGLGSFGFGMTLTGLTAEVLEATAKGRATLRNIEDPEERSKTELELASVMLKDMAFTAFSLRYGDLGLVNRLLDFAAEAQGVSREETADALAVGLPAMLLQSGDVAATALAAQASSAFLTDPKTIELKIDFPTPLSFAGLDLEDPTSEPEIPDDMTIAIFANGIGPIPVDLESLDIGSLLGEIEPDLDNFDRYEPDPRPSSPPRPGRDPRF